MITLYLDESGDHSLTRIDPQFPVFTLAGCAFDGDHEARAAVEVAAFKRAFFGNSDVILHTADITRNRNGFEQLVDQAVRTRFYASLNGLIRRLEFVVVAVAIRKYDHLLHTGEEIDPYHLALEIILERFYYLLTERGAPGRIVAESRNAIFDKDLRREFDRLMHSKKSYVRAPHLRSRIAGLEFREKRDNLVGLQIADLIATPISRFVIGKRTHEDFAIIEKNFRRSTAGEYRGYGLKILP
jgi:hypothetical protein